MYETPVISLLLCACGIGFLIPYCYNNVLEYLNNENEQLYNKFVELEKNLELLRTKIE
jgi:hypothetical protein